VYITANFQHAGDWGSNASFIHSKVKGAVEPLLKANYNNLDAATVGYLKSTTSTGATAVQMLSSKKFFAVDPSPSTSPSSTVSPTVSPSQSPSATQSTTPTPAAAVSASLQVSGLPATAFDASGKLTTTAVSQIATSLSSGIAAACASCSVKVTKVVDSAGNTVFSAARRLQTSYTVSYIVLGLSAADAAAAAATITTASVSTSLSASFGTTITATASPASFSDAFSAGAAVALPGGPIAGIAIACAVFVAAVLIWIYRRNLKDEDEDDDTPAKKDAASDGKAVSSETTSVAAAV